MYATIIVQIPGSTLGNVNTLDAELTETQTLGDVKYARYLGDVQQALGGGLTPDTLLSLSLSKDSDGSVIYYPRSNIRSPKCNAVIMFIVDKLELPRARDAAARARRPRSRATSAPPVLPRAERLA